MCTLSPCYLHQIFPCICQQKVHRMTQNMIFLIIPWMFDSSRAFVKSVDRTSAFLYSCPWTVGSTDATKIKSALLGVEDF